MGNEQQYERIEAYLSGQMSLTEAESFRQEISRSPELAAELALHRGVAEAIMEEEELTDLQNKIGAILKKEQQQTSPPATRRHLFSPARLRIAASVAVLILAVLAAYFYLQPSVKSPEILFSEYMDYPASIYEAISLRSNQETMAPPGEQMARLDSLWSIGNQQYQQANFAAALVTLEEVESLETQLFQQPTPHWYYTRGILLTQLEQFAGAISAFEQVTADYTEEAAWKRALLILREADRQADGVAALQAISSSNSPRQAAAKRLLEEWRKSN